MGLEKNHNGAVAVSKVVKALLPHEPCGHFSSQKDKTKCIFMDPKSMCG
jgi:hypothetical protein